MQNKEIKEQNKKTELFTKELETLQDKHGCRLAAVLEPSLTSLTAKIKIFTDEEINDTTKSEGKKGSEQGSKGSTKEEKKEKNN